MAYSSLGSAVVSIVKCVGVNDEGSREEQPKIVRNKDLDSKEKFSLLTRYSIAFTHRLTAR